MPSPASLAACEAPDRPAACAPASARAPRRFPGAEPAARGLRVVAGLRRALDVVASLLALAALAPLFVLLAVLVKATSDGPVFYRQVRVGRERRDADRRSFPTGTGACDRRRRERRCVAAYGRPFSIVKFRTMRADAEAHGPQWSRALDPRVTPLGRLLRTTRLDETPQFWNVLRGDMSLLGPRPERPFFVEQFAERIPRYRERLRVRPGITGLAQVTLDYDASLDDVHRKLEADLDWIHRRSWARDCAILLRTVSVVVTGRGAR
jgi:lipopolysaccharide/colanic/teichoic acid biosynthesis glycosyltransferase